MPHESDQLSAKDVDELMMPVDEIGVVVIAAIFFIILH